MSLQACLTNASKSSLCAFVLFKDPLFSKVNGRMKMHALVRRSSASCIIRTYSLYHQVVFLDIIPHPPLINVDDQKTDTENMSRVLAMLRG